jgi:hypothetical protein
VAAAARSGDGGRRSLLARGDSVLARRPSGLVSSGRRSASLGSALVETPSGSLSTTSRPVSSGRRCVIRASGFVAKHSRSASRTSRFVSSERYPATTPSSLVSAHRRCGAGQSRSASTTSVTHTSERASDASRSAVARPRRRSPRRRSRCTRARRRGAVSTGCCARPTSTWLLHPRASPRGCVDGTALSVGFVRAKRRASFVTGLSPARGRRAIRRPLHCHGDQSSKPTTVRAQMGP